jgi:hypothetical protein
LAVGSWQLAVGQLAVGQLDSWTVGQLDRFEKYLTMAGYILTKYVINHKINHYGWKLQRFSSVPKSI